VDLTFDRIVGGWSRHDGRADGRFTRWKTCGGWLVTGEIGGKLEFGNRHSSGGGTRTWRNPLEPFISAPTTNLRAQNSIGSSTLLKSPALLTFPRA